MKHLSFREFLEVGRAEWQVQRRLLLRHYRRAYRFPLQSGRGPWALQRNRLLRHYARGPLGIPTRIRQTRLINAVEQLTLPGDASVLDAGCGHAYSSLWLAQRHPGYRLRAIDLDAELVAAGKRNASAIGLRNVDFYLADVAAIDEGAAYDLVFSMDVLEHVADDIGTLRAFRRALRPTGTLILHLPRRHQEHRRILPGFREHTTPEHVRDEYTPAEVGERLTASGFEVAELRFGFGPWGELAFELNNLCWKWEPLRLLLAVLFYPACVLFAYLDTREDHVDGNSLLVIARPATQAPQTAVGSLAGTESAA